MSQVSSGKAFEYGMIKQIERVIDCEIVPNSSLKKAEEYYKNCENEEKSKIIIASDKIVVFLLAHDKRLMNGKYKAYLQSDIQGKYGDVRDIIMQDIKRFDEIGLSLKNRHLAVKHFRLSESIDFGKDWLGVANTAKYKNEIGKHDFYKIIKENGSISIQSFNIFVFLIVGVKFLYLQNPMQVSRM